MVLGLALRDTVSAGVAGSLSDNIDTWIENKATFLTFTSSDCETAITVKFCTSVFSLREFITK